MTKTVSGCVDICSNLVVREKLIKAMQDAEDIYTGEIKYSYSVANTVTGANAGGFVGMNTEQSLISNSYAFDNNISGNVSVGGFVGVNTDNSDYVGSYSVIKCKIQNA